MKIKELSLEERPRERLLKYGCRTLSNSELIALVLRQGSKKENVLELAHQLLKKYNLKSLSRVKLTSLKKIMGIGEVKACQIVACFELSRRLASFNKEKRVTIHSAKDVAKLFLPEMSTLKQENFKGIYLDARQRIIKDETLFVGTLNASLVHPREVFEPALREGAVALIIIHNHPSGDAQPSKEDLEVTEQLLIAGEVLGVELLDHIILGYKSYYSLREKGHITP